ncbi:MAG TPA: iron transporter [Methylomirabilota bacterium]|jgi:mono/diheme cytochrome c family protein|nr:iron transporter [Methylomirabilota bacterium]
MKTWTGLGAGLGLAGALTVGGWAAPPAGPVRTTMEELHRYGGVPPGWRFAVPAGDPRAGREVFAKLECYRCHAVRGEQFGEGALVGGGPGPELSGMGTLHPAEYLAESILNPNAVIVAGPGYTGPDGRSTMPDYRDAVMVGELLDLVAYLASLGAGPGAPAAAAAREQVAGGYRVRLDSRTPGDRGLEHVMVFVADLRTGEPVPYLPVSARIHAAKGAAQRVRLVPMVGAEGFHYGADLALPATTTRITVSIGATGMRVMPSAGGRFASVGDLSFDWKADGHGHHGH